MGDDPATLPSRVPLGLYPLSTTCAGPGPVDTWKIKMGYNFFIVIYLYLPTKNGRLMEA